MNVKIIDRPHSPITTIFKAFRTCYSADVPTEIKIPMRETSIGDIPDKSKMIEFIKDKMDLGHESPLEHASFTFAIEGVSRALSHQLVRHRIASYSQQSQRYCKLDQFEYVIPPKIKENPSANFIFNMAMDQAQESYYDLVKVLLEEYFKNYLLTNSPGICELKGNRTYTEISEHLPHKKFLEFEKKAIEDARYVFPNACCTNLVVTMNGRGLRNFLSERLCINAQWEIRELANKMLEEAEKIVPFVGYRVKKCNVTCFQCKEGK